MQGLDPSIRQHRRHREVNIQKYSLVIKCTCIFSLPCRAVLTNHPTVLRPGVQCRRQYPHRKTLQQMALQRHCITSGQDGHYNCSDLLVERNNQESNTSEQKGALQSSKDSTLDTATLPYKQLCDTIIGGGGTNKTLGTNKTKHQGHKTNKVKGRPKCCLPSSVLYFLLLPLFFRLRHINPFFRFLTLLISQNVLLVRWKPLEKAYKESLQKKKVKFLCPYKLV